MDFTRTLILYALHFFHYFSFLSISILLTHGTLMDHFAFTNCSLLLSSPHPHPLSPYTHVGPLPLPPRKSVGLSASSLSPHHTDPVAQSQRPLPDQLPGRVQILRRPFRLPEARQVSGGHCLLRGREGAGQREDRERGQEGDRNLQRDVHPHIRQVEQTFNTFSWELNFINI